MMSLQTVDFSSRPLFFGNAMAGDGIERLDIQGSILNKKVSIHFVNLPFFSK